MSLDPITALLNIGEAAINKFFPDPNQRAEQLFRLRELAQGKDLAVLNAEVQLLLAQIEVNKVEAASGDKFSSRWRPFIGWACGLSLVYAAMIYPFMAFIARVNGYTGELPETEWAIMSQILMALLGIGAMRSHDKKAGTSK